MKTLLFTDDQVLIAESEILLQKSVHKLENVLSKYGLTISTNKTKTMAYRGRDHIRSKIVINNKIIEQVNTFCYLGCTLSYKLEKDVTDKLSKFLKITGIINQVLKRSKVQKQTRL
jgi:transposase